MSANETMTVSSTGGQKAENDERYDLIPADALRELAKHYGVGAKKYEDRNWEKGYEWHKSYASLNRHLWAFWNGEDIDAETGSKHIIAVAWHAFVLATFMETYPDFDDRPSTLAAKRYHDEAAKEDFKPRPNVSEQLREKLREIQAEWNKINGGTRYYPGGLLPAVSPTAPDHVDSLEPEWTRNHVWKIVRDGIMAGVQYKYMYDRWWYKADSGEWQHSHQSQLDLNYPGGYDRV